MEALFHKACSVCPGSWALVTGLDAFLPHQGPPIYNHRAPHAGTPSLPTAARSKLRPGIPQVRPSRGHWDSGSKTGGQGGDNRTCGIWAVADGLGPCLGRR